VVPKIRRNIKISKKYSRQIAPTYPLHLLSGALFSHSPSIPQILVPPNWSEISGLFSRTDYSYGRLRQKKAKQTDKKDEIAKKQKRHPMETKDKTKRKRDRPMKRKE
jgi:hypothetical protein